MPCAFSVDWALTVSLLESLMAATGSETPPFASGANPDPRDCPAALLEHSRFLFEQHVASFERVDKKALGVIGVVAFLVGFQILRSQDVPPLGKLLERDVLGLVAFLAYCVHGAALFLTVVASLISLCVRKMKFPTSAGDLLRRYRDLLDGEATDADERIRVAIMKAVDAATTTVNDTVRAKTGPLRVAMVSLVVSVMGLLVYMIYIIYYGWCAKVGGIQ